MQFKMSLSIFKTQKRESILALLNNYELLTVYFRLNPENLDIEF